MFKKRNDSMLILITGFALLLLILVYGTIWVGRNASNDTQEAVSAVSSLYLDELAGRREAVVEGNLKNRIRDMNAAVELLEENDLSNVENLQAFQMRMRRLYNLEKFAFVNDKGLIYTATGPQYNISDYDFSYKTISAPEISILNLNTPEKSAVIAIPVDIAFGDEKLKVCFMEIDMDELLSGVSMNAEEDSATFCNIYTNSGVALSNTVLGGLAVEDNLLEAMKTAVYGKDDSYEKFYQEFSSGTRGMASFEYNGVRETLSYVPIRGTNWLLTYLIRESVISERISSVVNVSIRRSLIQSLLTAGVLIGMFSLIIVQSRRNARLQAERQAADAENRVKQEEMEKRLKLQERLLEEEKLRSHQDSMITAMASDYRSVYHVDFEKDEAICYRSDPEDTSDERYGPGDVFPYYEQFSNYGKKYVDEAYREGFLNFIDPENIRKGLKKEKILAYRYLVNRGGKPQYEMIRAAGVTEKGEEEEIKQAGIGFTIIDEEMRETMAKNEALSDAMKAAEQANKAKSAFLSNMSHEIRTPMNAIIGLDSIALNDPETPEKTKTYLHKIGASADHLLGLINDILDMSRIESGRLTLKHEEFSFRKLIEAINTMFSSQCMDKGLEYSCRILNDVDDHYIGDSMKLRQVLINILGNAVKFTPEGGKVSMEVEKKASYEGKTALCFTIADTGIGMSKDFLPKIFETFTQEDSSSTSKYGSSGLGMAITKNIVEMMNGNIEVESKKGKGSTFRVTVTLEECAHRVQDDESEIAVKEMNVLIVDDDDIALKHAALILEKEGVHCDCVLCGQEAIDKVKLSAARRRHYDLILVDWKMPDMDGIETTRKIREIIGDESAIIILTAYKWDDIMEEAIEAGVDSFVAKPLFAGAVIEEFRSAMALRKSNCVKKENKADLNGRRILLAEDVAINAEIIMMLLDSKNIQTDHCENGRIALEQFMKHPAGYYDAILMDMRMPEMDGLEATKRIRALKREDAKKIPIIALTANAFDEDVQKSLQAGLNAHLSKPVEPERLFETLESLIDETV